MAETAFTFETTRLPEYKRGLLWYFGAIATVVVLLAYFIFVEYSPLSFSVIGFAAFVYYALIFRPKNPVIPVCISDDGIVIRTRKILFKNCRHFSCLAGNSHRPAMLIIHTKRMCHTIPLPDYCDLPELRAFLKEKIEHRKKASRIHSLCHTFKI